MCVCVCACVCVCFQDEVEEVLNELEAKLNENADSGGRQPSGEIIIIILLLLLPGDASRAVRCVCECTLGKPKP